MPQPSKIPLPFAASGDKNTIPESTKTTGLASWREGFPAITSVPFSEGGIAPKRADFNGIFNALSQAVLWMQQGGVYAYDVTTDYEAGNVVLDVGGLYVANASNGPSSVVVQPSTDTTGATWRPVRLDLATQSVAGYMSAADKTKLDSVILTNATQSAAGYMSASDKTLVDSIPDLGTFNKIFFSQTSGSYTAPRTGVYRITLKGGGGGGGGGAAASNGPRGGSGGGEGGTLIMYRTLTKDATYPYTIGAGGAGGAQNLSGSGGSDGGSSSITIDGTTLNAYYGRGAGSPQGTSNAGIGGDFSVVSDSFGVYGAPGQTGPFLVGSGLSSFSVGGSGGGAGGGGGIVNGSTVGRYGGGGSGGSVYNDATYAGGDGGDGYILVEYAG